MTEATAQPSSAFTRPLALAGAFAGLYLALAFVYWPALHGTLLWNDPDYVTKAALQPVAGLVRIWGEPGATEQYYPLLHTAFWCEHRLWGDAPLGYHLATLGFHALSCVLFFALLERLAIAGNEGDLTYPKASAWFAAGLFAFHPVCVESVAWISEQKNTLSLVFSLGAALAYLRYERRGDWRSYGLALGLFLCAILSKSVTATLPAVLWVLGWWRRGRLRMKAEVLPLLPWCVAGAAVGLFTAWDERHFGGAEGAHFDLSPLGRWIVAGKGVWFYLGKIVWPHPLIFFYQRWKIVGASWDSWLGLVLAVGMTVALLFLARRCRGPLCCWLLFIGTLFPVLGFLNVYAFVFSFVADHWQYVSMLPILAGVSALWVYGTEKRPQWLRTGVPALVLVLLAVLSSRQSRMYASVESVYRVTLARNPDAWLAHANLGVIELDGGDAKSAAEEFRAAMALVPSYPELHANLANAYLALGQLPQAAQEDQRAVEISPDYASAHAGLARILILQGRPGEAIGHYREALRYRPNRADWDLGLGLAFAESGQPSEALAPYEAAIGLDPSLAEAYNDEGTALADLGRVDEATERFHAALRLRPDYTDARKNLAGLLEHTASEIANQGDLDRAIPLYREAVSMSPQLAAARCDLGLALTMKGQLTEAVEQLSEAIRLSPKLAQAHAYYGLALSRQKHFSEAIREFDASLAIAPADSEVLYQRHVAENGLAGR